MAAGFELVENPQAVSPKGSFQTKGDQTKFRSAFYPEDTGTEVSVLSSDGRARLNFVEYVGEKQSRNLVKVNGMTTRMKEYIVPIEHSKEFDRYAGAISEGKVDSFLQDRSSNMAGRCKVQDGTEIGKESSGSQQLQTINVPAPTT